MSPASPVSPAVEARAERQEWDRLMQRRRVLAPEDRCFCGSIEDLRRYVADLEARQVRHASRRPSQHHQHKQEHGRQEHGRQEHGRQEHGRQEHGRQEHDQPEREIEDEEIEP